MSLCKFIVVPKWEYSPQQGWMIEKSALINFLELTMPLEDKTSDYWTEEDIRTLFPNYKESKETNKINVLWELLEHYKSKFKSAA
jgi:hypothetical protein